MPNFSERRPAMHLNLMCLRQQMWRAEELFAEMHSYAERIGCTFGEGAMSDEIMCDDRQSRLLAAWWAEHTWVER